MKRIISVILVALMCLTVMPLASAAQTVEYPNEEQVASVLREMGMVTTWMGGSYFNSGEDGSVPAPDKTVWEYISMFGNFEEYYHEWDGTFAGYKVPYDVFMDRVDKSFINHSDMKDYLRRESTGEYPSLTYDESTDIISWFSGGMGDAVEWKLLDYECDGNSVYAYGIFIEMLFDESEIEGMRENYDYIVKYDEYGISYWRISYAMRLILDLEEGFWKIRSYDQINWYILDGKLYNRAYNVNGSGEYIVLKNSKFEMVDMSGNLADWETDLCIVDFGDRHRGWYEDGENKTPSKLTLTFKEGYEAERVVLYTENGHKLLTAGEDGSYEFIPEGNSHVMVYSKQEGTGTAVNSTDTTANFGQADLVAGKRDIINSILTVEEAEAVNNGAEAKVFLEVKDIASEITESDAALIKEAVGNESVALYLDVNLNKQIGDSEAVKVAETSSEVMICINLPENMLIEGDFDVVFKVYRLHDGKVELLESEFDMLSGGVLYFYTDKFSTYAISVARGCDTHTFSEWDIIQEPGDGYDGIRFHKCEVCGFSEYTWFTEDDVVIENPFTDIAENKWYTDSVLYCYNMGYMSGTSATTFDYKATMDRQMFATILAKIDGADLSSYTEMSFTDVEAGKWYSASIEWAYQNGYAAGVGEGIYGRKNPVTREQMAMFFYTYSEKNGIDVTVRTDISGYADYNRVHAYALDAMAWAVNAGIISGTSDTTLSPRDSATRGQVAVIVMSYVENVKNAVVEEAPETPAE